MHVAATAFVPSATSPSAARLIFPDESPTMLLAEVDGAAAAEPEEEEGKNRGRLILAAIVCNSVFWQYLYPTLKGEENALGKMINRDAEQGRK